MEIWQRRRGIMLCYPYESKRLEKWQTHDVILQPKLNGERVRAIIEGSEVRLLSSEENDIYSAPHITEALKEMNLPDMELDGEFYKHGMALEDIHGIKSRSVNLHDNYADIEYHIFDVINEKIQIERTREIYLRIVEQGPIRLVRTLLEPASTETIDRNLSNWLAEGYEGIIIRHPLAQYKRARSTMIMKFKPRAHDVYLVTGITQEFDKYGYPKDSMGALICMGADRTPFKVGSGFTAFDRSMFWDFFRDLGTKDISAANIYIRVSYQSKTKKGVPREAFYITTEPSPHEGEAG
jgi:ATP-dependent DNA ligase